MPFYHKQGEIPAKRHVQFRKPDGSLYAEELVSTEGFSSVYSLVYHCHPPTLVKNIGEPYDVAPKAAIKKNKIGIINSSSIQTSSLIIPKCLTKIIAFSF